MFPLFTDFLEKEELTLYVVFDQICDHLTALISNFNKFFYDIKVDDGDMMRNSFSARVLRSGKFLSAKAEGEHPELSSDQTLAMKLQNNT